MDTPGDMPSNSLEQCTYKDLQHLAKSLSLPSNVKKVHLIEMIYAKKNYSADRLESIVTHIKEERKQTAQPPKGTEILSAIENSPSTCTSPTSDSNDEEQIATRNVESDRVLRSYNNKLRRNYNNNVVGVQARNSVNKVQETHYEWNMELQSFRPVRSYATAQRRMSVQNDYVVRQPKPEFVDVNQTKFDPRERQLVPANYPRGSAIRKRRLSVPCNIKALVQKIKKTPQQSIINSQIAQTVVRKRLIQKPKVVSPRSALRPKVIENREAVDHFSNSSTESAEESSNDREFAPKMVTNISFQETFENVTFGENRNTLIRDFSIENARNPKPNLARRLDYDAYSTGNQTTRIDKACATETQMREANKIHAIQNHNNNQRTVVYAQKQSIPIDKTNATYNQTMRTNSQQQQQQQQYATENGTNTENTVYSSRSATNNNVDKNRADTESGNNTEIKNQPNNGGNTNQDVVFITDRDKVDYPNMSVLIDIDIGQTAIISQASNSSSDKSTLYYHKKIRAEQARTQRLSVSKESQPTCSLPHINEVFSQFNEPQFKNLVQTYMENEVDSTKVQYSTDDPLESLYKALELEQPYLQSEISAPDFCVDSTHTTTTAAGEASSNPEQGDNPEQREEQCNVVLDSPQLEDYFFDEDDKCDAEQREEQCNVVLDSPQLEDYFFDEDDKCDVAQLEATFPSLEDCFMDSQDDAEQREEQCNVVLDSPQLEDYFFDEDDKCDVAQLEATFPSLEDCFMDSQDDVFAQLPNWDELSVSANIEDALDFIGQDEDYMERIEMDVRIQCVLCDWAGPKAVHEHHVRHEHQSVIVPRSTSTWSTSISLGSARAGWRALSELHAHIYVLNLAWFGPDCCRAHITLLPNDSSDRPKFGRLTVYNKTTGEPHTWKGLIEELSHLPDEGEIKGLILDLSTLNLLPNSANITFVNGEWVMNSSSKVVVGPLELNDIYIEVHVEILD